MRAWTTFIVCALAAGPASARKAARTPAKAMLAKKVVHYFADDSGSTLLELRPDGGYRKMSYHRKESGRWRRLRDGRVRLASATRYRDINAETLSVAVWDRQTLLGLPAMRKRIAALLAGNKRTTFSIREVKSASGYTSRFGRRVSGVSAVAYQKKVSRQDLVELIAAIDTYRKDKDKNASYRAVYRHPQPGLFADDFDSWATCGHLLQKLKKDRVKIPDGDGMIGQLNNLLKRRGLHKRYPRLRLAAEGPKLLAREAKLSEGELIRLNRLVLEAAYPKACPKGVAGRAVIFLFDPESEFENLDEALKKIDAGLAPRFALRRIGKKRYLALLRKEEAEARMFAKHRKAHERALAAAPKLPPAKSRIHFFPPRRPQYFADSMAHTRYLVFRPGGRYRETSSSHLCISETDRGSWKQSASGRIRMVSARKFHHVRAASLSVRITDKEDLARLKPLKSKISAFLAANTQKRFSADAIKALMQAKYPSGTLYSVIDVGSGTRKVSRRNLVKLHANIDKYLKNPEKNVFYGRPYTYRSFTFLIFEHAIATLDDIKEALDKRKRPFVYTAIDAKHFKHGSKRTQPFRTRPK